MLGTGLPAFAALIGVTAGFAAIGVAATLLVLAVIAGCALVLDAFEIILVIVPLLMPPRLLRAPDAVWAAVLAMLVLQASFLAPPMGYAVMLARGFVPVPTGPATRALAPYLAALALVLALTAAVPGLVHVLVPRDTAPVQVMSDEQARRALLAIPADQDNGE